MDDASPPSSNGSNSHPDQRQDALDELRQLLLEPEHEQLQNLKKNLDESRLDTERLSRSLPEAIQDLKKNLDESRLDTEQLSRMLPEVILRREKPDPQLSTALFPSIEQGLQVSIKKNPSALVEAISPVMFPAIRQAIAQALQGMVQSLNQTLESSFSLRGLKWRWEAMRTGKPFAEVVLLHTLLYSVEQVFLIHRENGLLLWHVAADTVQMRDPEAVSGMMTAIRDFVHDAFQVKDNDSLDAFHVGDLTVWVEQGAAAYLAALVRGNPPQEVRTTLQDTLATIHREYDRALDEFQGDNKLFETAEPALEACLLSQKTERKRQRTERKRQLSPMFLRFGLGVLLGLIVLGFGSWLRAQWRWDGYVEQLQNLPGIVVMRAEKGWRRYRINGLRDPDALDPEKLLVKAKIPTHKVISLWEPYQALYPEFVLKRILRVLQPPETVKLVLQDGKLVASGSAPQAWIVKARDLTHGFPGVVHWRALITLSAK